MFVVQDEKVLLIQKLTGIGKGKVNGPGGKVDPGETPYECVISIHCHVFMASDFEGTPTPTKEAVPMWTKISEIPWGKMWEDDAQWLPQMLEGQKFLGKFIFEGESMQWCDVALGEEGQAGWMI